MTKHLDPCEDPRRRGRKLEAWPVADRVAWEAALVPADLLDGTMGPGNHWGPDTREKYRKGHGRWLNFLIMSRQFDPNMAPPPPASARWNWNREFSTVCATSSLTRTIFLRSPRSPSKLRSVDCGGDIARVKTRSAKNWRR